MPKRIAREHLAGLRPFSTPSGSPSRKFWEPHDWFVAYLTASLIKFFERDGQREVGCSDHGSVLQPGDGKPDRLAGPPPPVRCIERHQLHRSPAHYHREFQVGG